MEEIMVVISVKKDIKFLCELNKPIKMTDNSDTTISTFASEATVGHYLQLKEYHSSHLEHIMGLEIIDVERITIVRNK